MSITHLPKFRGALTRLAGAAALTTGLLLASAAPSDAGAQDYQFELDGQPAKSGNATIVKVRLVRLADGKPVPGAVIIQTRFDMGPEGMASMTAPAKAMPASDAGVYRVETQPSVAGHWALTLSVKVPGEAETVRGTVTVAVSK